MDVHAGRSAGGGLRFHNAIEGSRGILSNVKAGSHAAISRNYGVQSVLIHDMDRPAIKEFSVLAKDERFGAFPNNRGLRNDKDVLELFDGDAQSELTSGAESP